MKEKHTLMTEERDQPMKRLFQYLRSYKKALGVSIGASIVNKFFDLMPPILTAWFIDTVSGNVPSWIPRISGIEDLWQTLLFLAVIVFFVHVAESFFEWMFKKGFLRLAQEVQHDLRMAVYNKMQAQKMSFFETQQTGNLMAILNDDVNQLERFLNNSFNKIIQLIILVLFAGSVLLNTSLILGLLSMIPIPFIILGSIYYQKKVAPYYSEVRVAVGELSNRLENNISGIAVIKSFATELFEMTRVGRESMNYRNANFKAIRLISVYIPLIRIIIAVSFTAVLLIGSYWVLNDLNGLTLGSLAFFAMMIQRLLWPITELGQVFDDYERARASSRRIFNLLDSPPSVAEAINAEDNYLEKISGRIIFDSVEFSYNSAIPVLRDISFHLPEGQSLGIAGSTGGGKTTVVKLLMRFYHKNKGAITIGDRQIEDIPLRQLRKSIAFVSQEVFLFYGSIKDNISYGTPNASFKSIVRAAEQAKFSSFVDTLPQGYDTLVGEKGIKLSGGQRQRLSIARALLKNAPILIMDEATSAVDVETEKAIQSSLEVLMRGRTSIIIAHRLSTLKNCSKILVIDQGRITEAGNHQELIARDKTYAELWRLQVSG